MIKADVYMKIIMTIIAVCLIKLAFFTPPRDSFAQFPFLSSSDTPVDVNLKSIDDNEFFFSKNGDLHIGGKKGPKIAESGVWVVKIIK